MLTYDAIRQLVAKEKETKKLVELPEDFFSQARSYLDKKSRMHSKDDMWEFDSAKSLLQDLVEIRERKILLMTLHATRVGIEPANLTAEEKEFFDDTLKTVKEWQEKKKELLEAKPEPKEIVALLGHLPRFVGINMKEYGPFNPGDIATLPVENARLLEEKGLGRPIKAHSPGQN